MRLIYVGSNFNNNSDSAQMAKMDCPLEKGEKNFEIGYVTAIF